MKKNHLSWGLRLVAAVILLQTLYFKFTGAPESVAIFTQLGLEPHGRIGIGIAELIASILLLLPQTVALGALLGTGLMAGALMSHLTQLGFAGEMLSLSLLALLVFVCCVAALFLHRKEIPWVGQFLDREGGAE
ncbi:MAG: DoxX family protein [Puniceicoccaceae bacterium]